MSKQTSLIAQTPNDDKQLALPTSTQLFSFADEAPTEAQLTPAMLLDVDEFTITRYELVDTRWGQRVVWHIVLPDGPASFSMGIVTDNAVPQYAGKMNQERLALMGWFDQHPDAAMTGAALIALPVANGNDAYRLVSAQQRALQQRIAPPKPTITEVDELPF